MTDDTPTDKKTAPPCGLYLRIPENPDMEEWQPRLLAMRFVINNNKDYTKNMHVIECSLSQDASRDAVEKAAAFVQVAQLSGFVAIINGPTTFVAALEADGVLLNDVKDIEAAKSELDEDKIIGLSCGTDTAQAQIATAKEGADYVTFGNPLTAPDAKLIAQYTTQTNKPCAVLGQLTANTASLYATAGATFLDITHALTHHKDGPMQATVNMLHEIDLVAGSVKIN